MNFTDEQIEYIKNASDHVEMLCGGRGHGKTHQLINEMQDKINNLQSKIDKAIEYINNLRDESAERQEFYDCFPDDLYIPNIDELLDILKEDK